MTKEEAKEYIKNHPEVFFESAKKTGYVCPLCENGTGSNGTGIEEIQKNKGHFKCFKCDESGDVLHFIGKKFNLSSFSDILEAAYSIYGIIVDDKKYESRLSASMEKPIKVETKSKDFEETKSEDYTDFFKEANANLNNDYNLNKENYLSQRGISIETQNKFKIGYKEDWISPSAKRAGKNPQPSKRVIIPTSNSSYLARSVNPDIKDFKAMKEGKSHLFNSDILSIENNEPIFITEGEIDALSVIEAGGQAIGLGGINNINLFIRELEKRREATRQRIFIICLDNDEAGKAATKKLEDELKKGGYVYIDKSKELMDDCKDPNEALTKNKENFTSAIEEIKVDATEIIKREKEDYIQERREKLKTVMYGFYDGWKTIPTGLATLDGFLDGGMHTGLYVLGAASGAGKTTLALQIADNMAKDKHSVLFFSGEMSFSEITAKRLSRISKETSQGDNKKALTMRTIMNIKETNNTDYINRLDNELLEKINNDIPEYIDVIDGLVTIQKIEEEVAKHKKIMSKNPVVFIDYLQLVKDVENSHREKRFQIDEVISKLRIMATAYKIPVVAISTLNRAAYKNDKGKGEKELSEEKDIFMADLKESGGIEYGADVILALNAEKDESDKDYERDMKLRIIKNRTGQRHKKKDSIKLKFHTMFNYFEDADYDKQGDKYNGEKCNDNKDSGGKGKQEMNHRWSKTVGSNIKTIE